MYHVYVTRYLVSIAQVANYLKVEPVSPVVGISELVQNISKLF